MATGRQPISEHYQSEFDTSSACARSPGPVRCLLPRRGRDRCLVGRTPASRAQNPLNAAGSWFDAKPERYSRDDTEETQRLVPVFRSALSADGLRVRESFALAQVEAGVAAILG